MSRSERDAPVIGHATRVDALVSELLAVLAHGGIGEPRREASDIVAALLDRPRLWPAAHGDAPVSDHDAGRMRAAARRRATGAPFAYAVARASFRHLTLAVDERVLIPRVETEELVTAVLEAFAGREGGTAVDLGTGSGAIALSLAQEGPFERVIGTDLSTGALTVARENAERCAHQLRAPVEFRAGSWLAPVAGLRARAVVGNPPYIAHDEAGELPRSVRDWEPALALFSADSGMRDIACIIREAPGVLETGGLLALEVDSRRASLAAELALADGRYRDVSVRLDLAGRERILMARRGEE
jgi:release factor glutamine methyltransferase